MGTNAPKSGEANPAEPTPCYKNSSKEQLAWQEIGCRARVLIARVIQAAVAM